MARESLKHGPTCVGALGAVERIVVRASTLAERLGDAYESADPSPEEDDAARRRLARWRDVVASGDETRFARRLTWSGTTCEHALSRLGAVRRRTNVLPAWARLLDRVVHTSEQLGDAHAPRPDRVLEPEAPVAFEEILLPFVLVARRRLERAIPPRASHCASSALVDLERALLLELSRIADRALFAEFEALREEGARDDTRTLVRARYVAFVGTMRGAGLWSFFERFSALARLLAMRTRFWLGATTEMLHRLAADRAALGGLACAPSALGQVVRISSALSDSHHGARAVAILRFEDGSRVVYKPRNIDAELAFARVLSWVNVRRNGAPLVAPRMLARGDYGWVEFVARRPPANRREAQLRDERSGALLALMYALGGEDMHAANVRTDGANPVLIDLEALLHPSLADPGFGDGAASSAWGALARSVLATSLLPQYFAGAHGAWYFDGGFARDVRQTPPGSPRWHAVNTDTMARRYAERRAAPLAQDRADAFTARSRPWVSRGFRATYALLQAHRDELLAADGPLASFCSLLTRIVFRPTDMYASLLRRSTDPLFLREGVDRSIELDILRRPALKAPRRHPLWRVFDGELAALEQLDVPLFHLHAAETTLRWGTTGRLKGYAARTGIDVTRQRIQAMDDQDRHRQLHIVRLAYRVTASRSATPGGRDRTTGETLSPDDALAEAVAIGDELARAALRSSRKMTWVSFGDARVGGELRHLDASLALGRAGIALFFAALHRVTGLSVYADYARRALGSVGAAHRNTQRAERIARAHGPGAATGVGGLLYALTRIATWTGDDTLLLAASGLATTLTVAASTPSPSECDVYAGHAGTLLGLAALHQVAPRDQWHESLSTLGVALAKALSKSSRAKSGGKGRLRTRFGFGHGAPGVSYALAVAHRHTGDVRLLVAAREVLRVLHAQHQNAPDVANDESWCGGGVGDALMLATAPSSLLDAETHALLSAHTRRLASAPLSGPLHLCCGLTGRLDALLAADVAVANVTPTCATPSDAPLARATARLARHIAAGVRFRGVFGNAAVDGAFTPTLFYGMAGIGYELLRYANPRDVPSVLAYA